ncbi:LYT1p [Trypanosoma rangeli]|uniref:LYT1p n=1 Tax=Trypanosoma rangeli TaxID=5698 RepID=A0A3R7KCU4_TRYRA|nr:LYT1p [Trypanosoma rangeli]RNF03957.1 LYT1p [Trypanosoma rangeli]|eukprot:RNF03957.1 LYT1p [Trypanosoma rangeli]
MCECTFALSNEGVFLSVAQQQAPFRMKKQEDEDKEEAGGVACRDMPAVDMDFFSCPRNSIPSLSVLPSFLLSSKRVLFSVATFAPMRKGAPPTVGSRPTCRGAATSRSLRGRSGSHDGCREQTDVLAARPVGSQIRHAHREVRVPRSADTAGLNSYVLVEAAGASQPYEVAAASVRAHQNGGLELKEVPVVNGVGAMERSTQQKQEETPQGVPAGSAEQQQTRHYRDNEAGGSATMHPADRIQALEQLLLHMSALNRQLELELIETRRELMAYKQLLPEVPCLAEARAPPLSRKNVNSAEPSPRPHATRRQLSFLREQQQGSQGGISRWETTLVNMRQGCGEAEVDALSDGAGRPCRTDNNDEDVRSPGRLLSTQPPKNGGVQRQQQAANRADRNSRTPYHCGQTRRPAEAASATHRRDRSMRRRIRHRETPQFPERFNAEEAVDMLEFLKRSLMYRCNHSHHRSPVEVARPAAKPRKSAQSVPPSPQRKCNAAAAGARLRSVSARHAKSHVVAATRDAGTSNRGAAPLSTAYDRSSRAKNSTLRAAPGQTMPSSGKVTPMRKDTLLSLAPAAAAAVGDDVKLEALHKRYWEQSRAILEQLDQMLLDD